MKPLVIIPAYNEEKSLVSTISQLTQAVPGIDFIVINDGSADATPALCYQNAYPLLDLATNLGLTGAFVTGMIYADLHDYDIAVQFDADGQHRPEYLPSMIAAIEQGADVVCGSRFLNAKKSFTPRQIGNSFIATMIRLTSGKRLTDPTSGLRAYSKRVIHLFATQSDITPEPDTLSCLVKLGATVTEIPVIMNDRIAGSSYFTLTRSIKYMTRMLISILILQSFRSDSLSPRT